jgi:Fe-S cluster biogenesis protein NfuA/nitrite reductase/ring-hydroxylating ferredoxin subunit
MSDDLRAAAGRIETLVREFGALPDPRARHQAEEIVRLLMELYGAGLARIIAIAGSALEETPGARERLFARLDEDPLVTSLLVLHELHPRDTRSRVSAALERVRPYLGSHGGNVELLGVEGGIVRLRLQGSCDGCPSSSLTIKLAIEKAIQDAAPEVEHIEVDGDNPAGAGAKTNETGDRAAAEWITLKALPEFDEHNIAAAELAGTRIILCRVGATLYAYQDLCPACGACLNRAALRGEMLACPGCQHRYDVRLAGRCLESDAFHLEPLPLLAEERAVRISIPVRL